MIPVMFALRPFIPCFSRDHITIFNFFILKMYPSLLEAFNQLDIFLLIKANRHAFQSRPSSSTHTVDIKILLLWQLRINNVTATSNINTPFCYGCCDNILEPLLLNILQRPFTYYS